MSYLPLFPLNLVAYPGETLNLHIFEPRYIQLINECLENDSSFGMPVVREGNVLEFGTEMKITEMSERYDNGAMDIRTLGLRVFRLLNFDNPAEGKLYAGGNIEFLSVPKGQPPVMEDLMKAIRRLYELMGQTLEHKTNATQPFSFQVAHTIVLPPEDEYRLLTLETETARQVFLLMQLQRIIPVLEDVERTKARIRMNGHFQEFGPLDL
jgi:Lon protease-like protein